MIEEDILEEEIEGLPYGKAPLLDRFLAKLIDFIIAGFLFELTPVTGPVAAVTYILICDGFSGGQSVGKRLAGLTTISLVRDGGVCDFLESIKRNAIFAAPFVLCLFVGWIPYVGKLLVAVAALVVVLLEAYTIYEDDHGLRIGDRLAATMVVKKELQMFS